jgi:molybdate transport system substrate-binding protein
MSASIKAISSMATRPLLAELSAAYRQRSGCIVEVECVGGVDAARRVQAGEPFDAVFLAARAIDELIRAGRVLAGSRVDLVESGVAVAVKAGTPRPAIGTEDELREAVLAARSIGYSTGPSGVALSALFERWGVAGEIRDRIVQAPPGVPVGSLLGDGRVTLAFQQLSELISLEGVDVIGPLPQAVQIITTFSGAVCAASAQADAVRRMLDFMASPETAETKRRQGMEPA